MTGNGGDPVAWFLTTQALDHHATVEALTEALLGHISDDTGGTARELAERAARDLAAVGLALVPITRPDGPVSDDLTVHVMKPTEEQEDWFTREED